MMLGLMLTEVDVVVVVMRRVRGYLLRRVASANAGVLKGSTEVLIKAKNFSHIMWEN